MQRFVDMLMSDDISGIKNPSEQDQAAISELAKLLNNMQEGGDRYVDKLRAIKKDLTAETIAEDADHYMGLLLQLRLDQVDVLRKLMKLHKSYCNAIGIDPLSPQAENLERALYALSHDGLKHALFYISSIFMRIEEVVQESKRKQQREKLKKLRDLKEILNEFFESGLFHADSVEDHKRALKEHSAISKARREHAAGLTHELHDAIDLQSHFEHSIDQLTEAFHAYEGLPKFGLIHDYIAGLEGPISVFYIADKNGLNLVRDVAVQFEHAYQHVPTVAEQFDEQYVPDEKLELAACTARTTPFFH